MGTTRVVVGTTIITTTNGILRTDITDTTRTDDIITTDIRRTDTGDIPRRGAAVVITRTTGVVMVIRVVIRRRVTGIERRVTDIGRRDRELVRLIRLLLKQLELFLHLLGKGR